MEGIVLANVNVDAQILEALQLSTCFGIAHDETVPECKQCDVKGSCKSKSEGASIPTPTEKPKVDKPVAKAKEKAPAKPKATKEKAPAKAKTTPKPEAKKAPAKVSGDMPNFKDLSLDELKALAGERSVEWKDYNNDQITRMRLIMNLKKSY